MRDEMSPNLIENVPPKPQQVSQSAISVSCDAGDRRQQLARLLLDAHLAQARAGVVIGDACRQNCPGTRSIFSTLHEKIGELVSLGAERLTARQHRRIVAEQIRDSAC